MGHLYHGKLLVITLEGIFRIFFRRSQWDFLDHLEPALPSHAATSDATSQ